MSEAEKVQSASAENKNEIKKLKRKNRRLKTWLVILLAIGVACGWLLGTFSPLPVSAGLHSSAGTMTKGDSKNKFEEVLSIMDTDWFFANQIDDIDTRLTDQALKGLTDNEEDTHTEYMSEQEIADFTQSINRNFVGIGVQFRSTDDGLHIITRVLPDSPAEKAGVQAGDIIHAVEGTVVDNKTSTEIKELVQGEKGTTVSIDFIREGKVINIKIVRDEVSSTVYGSVKEDDIGYLSIQNFGNSTAEEVKSWLDDFEAQGVTGLIIDLRDDGGGYLDALKGVVDCFLPKNTVFLRRVYSDGSSDEMKTDGGTYESFGPIVLLVNENTASAAEAFTIAMKEERDDVTIVGTTTYGKGTVQITKYFDDGSALKYTNSKWTSPSGVWVNGTGIEPDETVKLHDVLYMSYASMEDGTSVAFDSVDDKVKEAQSCLDFLGYDVDRMDGYFDVPTQKALQQFETDNDLSVSEDLTSEVYDSLLTKVVVKWNTDESADVQLQRAQEILHG